MRARISSVAFLALSLIVTQAGQVSEALLNTLSSEEFKQREQAQLELQELALGGGQAILLELLDHSKNSSDPEVRKRCLSVLRAVSNRDYLRQGKGFLGILMREEQLQLAGEEKVRTCVRISQIVADSPAEESLKIGDLIIAVDGETWHELGDSAKFSKAIADKKPLDRITLSLIRGEKVEPIELEVVLGRRPSEDLRQLGQGNLQTLQALARERHFEKWLEELEQSEARE